MVNYAFAFSQSEMEKYFEWIVMIVILILHLVIFCIRWRNFYAIFEKL